MRFKLKLQLVMVAIQAGVAFSGFGILFSIPTDASDNSAPFFAYVTALGSNTVSIINTTTDTVVATVSVGDGPFAVGVSSDRKRVYVANHFDATVSIIDGVTHSVIATLSVGPEPIGVGVSPDGTKAYIASAGSEVGAGSVSVIDAATNQVIATIPLPAGPFAAAVSGDGQCLYVGSQSNGGEVFVIDTATNQVVGSIALPTGSGPDSLAIATQWPFGYTVNSPIGEIAVINLSEGRVLRSVATGGGNVQAVAVTPDRRRIYATDSGAEQVVVLDSASQRIIQRIALPPGSNPIGVSLTPDGMKAYVANNASGSVAVIDTNTNTVQGIVPVSGFPYAKGQFIAPGISEPAPPVARCIGN